MHVGGERDDGDKISGLHLFVNEFFCRVHGAVNILGLHCGEIEEKKNQAAIASIEGGRRFLGGVKESSRGCRGGARDRRAGSGGQLIDVLKIEAGNLLFLAVFVEGKVLFFQILDYISPFVASDDIHKHEFGGDLNHALTGGETAGVLSDKLRARGKQRRRSQYRESFSYASHESHISETKTNLHRDTAHAPRGNNFAEGRGVHRGDMEL